MAGEIYRRTRLNFGGAFAADRGIVTFRDGIVPNLMQSLSLNYAQQVSRVYELGELGQIGNVYYVGGRSQGSASFGRILGPNTTLERFYQTYSDSCEASKNNLSVTLAADCYPAGDVQAAFARQKNYTARYCVLVNVGVSTQAQDLLINENSNVMFSNLDYNEANALGAALVPGVVGGLLG